MAALGFVIRRVGIGLVTLFIVVTVVFLALQMLPGGYADIVLGPRASEAARAAATEKFGLDQPPIVQFFKWLGSALRGDLGVSMISGKPVVSEIAARLPATIQVATLALVIAVVSGAGLGLIAGLARRRAARGVARAVGTLTLSVPDFVIGTVLLYFATVGAWGLTNLPYTSVFADFGLAMRSIILPSLALGVGGIALVMRTFRGAVLRTLSEPFIATAVARGESPGQIVRRHILRNSATSTITVGALLIGGFLGATVVVETLFSVPGIGGYFTSAIRNRDFAVVQAIVLLSSTVFIVANILVDVVQVAIDPRRAKRRSA